mgnify:CR=1 FL=1
MKETSGSAAAEKKRKKKINAYQRRQNRLGYLFMMPDITGPDIMITGRK